MSTYLKAQWRHDSPTDPVLLYSEIGADGYERRKVQVFPDGRTERADGQEETPQTGLSDLPVVVDDIPAEFTPEVIGRAEFEALWEQAAR